MDTSWVHYHWATMGTPRGDVFEKAPMEKKLSWPHPWHIDVPRARDGIRATAVTYIGSLTCYATVGTPENIFNITSKGETSVFPVSSTRTQSAFRVHRKRRVSNISWCHSLGTYCLCELATGDTIFQKHSQITKHALPLHCSWISAAVQGEGVTEWQTLPRDWLSPSHPTL